ncbi:MAG: MATE family efflux transporter [Candidatus Schekmanbacteria bacterium]|nr:MATE family efflux transporter [Candidatus Schekmanbacteria bacterium]
MQGSKNQQGESENKSHGHSHSHGHPHGKISIDLTEGNISKNLWSLASPMIISQIVQTVFYIADLIFVGMVGSTAIASVSIATIFMMTLSTAAHGLSIGTTAIIARLVGQRKDDEAAFIAGQSIMLCFLLGAAIGIPAYFKGEALFGFLGANEELVKVGVGYFKISLLGIFALFLQFITSSIFRATGEARISMLLTLMATALHFIFDPLLIFGIGPFPKLGVNGAAYASIIALVISSATGTIMLLSGSYRIKVVAKDFTINLSALWRIFKIAIPAASRRLIRDAARMVMMKIVAIYGTSAIAAYGIGMRLDMIAMLPGMGLSAATSTLVGQNLGAGKPENSEKSTWISVKHLSLIMSVFAVIFFVFAPYIISMFDRASNVISAGTEYMHYISISYIFVAIIMVIGGAFNGAGDAMSPLVISGSAAWILQLPLAGLLATKMSFGPAGIWGAILLSAIIESAAFLIWFKQGNWKLKKV